MARYRRRMASLIPVNRIKHVVDLSGTLTAASQINNVIALSTDTPTLAATTSVETGSKVNGIYLKVEVASNEAQVGGAIPNVYMSIFKNPGGGLTTPTANAIGANDLKRYIIHQEMVMIDNKLGGNPRILFNGVIPFPKGYRRNGPGDAWVVSVLCPQIDIAYCVQCIYKEFR